MEVSGGNCRGGDFPPGRFWREFGGISLLCVRYEKMEMIGELCRGRSPGTLLLTEAKKKKDGCNCKNLVEQEA